MRMVLPQLSRWQYRASGEGPTPLLISQERALPVVRTHPKTMDALQPSGMPHSEALESVTQGL